ncbi:MAG: adenylate/guanylate cyclase domain-containing protein, partial [Flavobacteriaceae bacterium]
KEIAYHGDTVNTAARIQKKCNELGHELLISENLMRKLENTSLSFERLGIVPLKGKQREVEIFAVNR